MNKCYLVFFIQKPDDELSLQTRELKIMNVSTLSLTTGLKLKQPFQIIKDDGSETSEMVNLERKKHVVY